MLALLLSYNITPIMVFDGYDTPAKEHENSRRREVREKSKEEALEMIRRNKGKVNSEIMRLCMRAIQVTPEIVARVVALCNRINVKVVIAPFEADAQVAYLVRSGIAHCAISEDSDLLAYGCPKVWYKLERDGKADEISLPFGTEIDKKATKGILKGLNHRMFISICILSGTDYDDGNHIYGLGIKLAHKFILQYETIANVINALQECPNWSKKLPKDVNFDSLISHYEATNDIFLHNVVYDICNDTLRHINPITRSEDAFLPIISPMIEHMVHAKLNFAKVSQGGYNLRTLEYITYEPTKQDLALIEGISFKSLPFQINQKTKTVLELFSPQILHAIPDDQENPLTRETTHITPDETPVASDVADSKLSDSTGGDTPNTVSGDESDPLVNEYEDLKRPKSIHELIASTECHAVKRRCHSATEMYQPQPLTN
ncbi:bifunctional XPG-I domain/PIN-like domain superfamily/Exonuclease 1-like [Babesia duncani]|nr:bifunctional XPG-I domain/PIN-like domain superfamily/Exonuclease 1-like [Babesia duncani]